MNSSQDNNNNSNRNSNLSKRKAKEQVIQLLKGFIEDYEQAASIFGRDKNQGKMEFHQFLNDNLGFDFRLQIGKWKKIHEDDLPRTIDLVKILTTNYFLKSQYYSKLNLASLLSEDISLNPEILKKFNQIPEAYLTNVTKNIEEQIKLQESQVYNSLHFQIQNFRIKIDNILQEQITPKAKIRKLHDIISIIFRWYTFTFNKGRAILYLKTEYWNGPHRSIKFNRSRATKEFVSRSSKYNKHTQDIDWIIQEQEPEVLLKYCDNIFTLEDIQEIQSNYSQNSISKELLNKKQRLIEELSRGDNWALEPKFYSEGQIQQVGTKDIWNDIEKESLAYNTIYKRKEIATNYLTRENYLRGFLDEAQNNTLESDESDKSGYAIPLLSPDRKSTRGVLMVVSNDPNAFTEESFDKYKKESNWSCEYSIIYEIADLVRYCINNIDQESGNIYNIITILEQEKYFPEIVFDIWYHNLQVRSLLYESENDDKNDFKLIQEALSKAFSSYEEILDFHNSNNNSDALNKFNSIYEQALSDYKPDINIRFATAVKICLKELFQITKDEKKPATLETMFQVRKDIEEKCLNLAQKSFQSRRTVISDKMSNEYLNPLKNQAQAIQNFIKFLTPILKNKNSATNNEEVKSQVETFLKSIKHLQDMKNITELSNNINKFEQIYRKFILDSINNKEQLKNLIYRLHAHFHITLHLLSTMELLPYAGMFAILATSTSNSIDRRFFEKKSHEEHDEILNELESSYNSAQHKGEAGQKARLHIESILERMKNTETLKDILNKPLPRNWGLNNR